MAFVVLGSFHSHLAVAQPFIEINAGLPGVYDCSLSWGDYDKDGDLDLALAGHDGSVQVSRIYRNDGAGEFTDINAGLAGTSHCSLAWGDYDNDGDLDLVVAGYSSSGRVSRIYRNDGGDVFTDINAGLMGVSGCSLAWGDYDNDGDLDLAIAGYSSAGNVSKIYRNDGGDGFTDINTVLTGVIECSLAWGDHDNDGDRDLAIAGGSEIGYVTRVYRNDSGEVDLPPPMIPLSI
jgi:hypothetical protein